MPRETCLIYEPSAHTRHLETHRQPHERQGPHSLCNFLSSAFVHVALWPTVRHAVRVGLERKPPCPSPSTIANISCGNPRLHYMSAVGRGSKGRGTHAVHAQQRGGNTRALPQKRGRNYVRSYPGQSDRDRKQGISKVSWYVGGRCFV